MDELLLGGKCIPDRKKSFPEHTCGSAGWVSNTIHCDHAILYLNLKPTYFSGLIDLFLFCFILPTFFYLFYLFITIFITTLAVIVTVTDCMF